MGFLKMPNDDGEEMRPAFKDRIKTGLEKYRLWLAILVLALTFFSGLVEKLQEAVASKIRGEATKTELTESVARHSAHLNELVVKMQEQQKLIAETQAKLGSEQVRIVATADDLDALRERLRILESQTSQANSTLIEMRGAFSQFEKNLVGQSATVSALVSGLASRTEPTPTPKPTPTPTPCKPSFFKKC